MSTGNVKVDLLNGVLTIVEEARVFGALAQRRGSEKRHRLSEPKTPTEWVHAFIKFLEERYGRPE